MTILDRFRLDGKTALVTGCNRGMAEAGADIVGVSANLAVEGSACELAVTALGRSFTGYRCNFSDRPALLAFIEEVGQHHRIDILVNNAGTIKRAPGAEHDDATWDEVIETNLTAPFILAREFGRRMISNGGARLSSPPLS